MTDHMVTKILIILLYGFFVRIGGVTEGPQNLRHNLRGRGVGAEYKIVSHGIRTKLREKQRSAI